MHADLKLSVHCRITQPNLGFSGCTHPISVPSSTLTGNRNGTWLWEARVFKCGNRQFWFKSSVAYDTALNS